MLAGVHRPGPGRLPARSSSRRRTSSREEVIRLLMLVGAIVVPAVVGAVTLALAPGDERSARGRRRPSLRGYPLTIVLAVLLVFLAVLAIWRKASSLARRWTDAHVPDRGQAGRLRPGRRRPRSGPVRRRLRPRSPRTRPAAMSKPAKWLAAIAGRTSSALVPDRMLQLRGPRARHPDLPDGRPDLGQARCRDPGPGGDGQPADDVRRASDGQRRGAGHRGPAGRPGARLRGRRPPRFDEAAAADSRPSTRSSRRSGSRTRNGRSSTASDSRSSATCAPGRWPATR